MNKRFVYLFVLIFSFFVFKGTYAAKTMDLICDYNSSTFNAKVVIYSDSSTDTNVTKFSGTPGNLDNDETLHNWNSSTFYYDNGAVQYSIDTTYDGKATYNLNKKCPEYFVYGFLNDCTVGCVHTFVADTLDQVRVINNIITLDVTSWRDDSPTSYVNQISSSTVPNSQTIASPDSGSDGENELPADCNIIPQNVKDLLTKGLNIFRFVAPILLLVFSSVDFLKATVNSDKDDLKKAGINLLKRLIICVVLFFVPTVINILLDVIGNSNGTCGVN